MTDAERQRLAAILGMLGSDHAGERDAAARQAEAFRRKHGLTWEELIQGKVVYLGGAPPWARTIEEKVVYVDRPVLTEPSPWIDRLLIIAVFVGVPGALVLVAGLFH